MKFKTALVLLLVLPILTNAQNPLYKVFTKDQAEGLKQKFKSETNDSLRMAIAKDISFFYQGVNWDSSAYYAEKELELAKKNKQLLWQSQASWFLALASIDNYPKAFNLFTEAIQIAEDKNCEKNIWGLKYLVADGKPRNARLNVLSNTINDRSHLYGATGSPDKRKAGFYETVRIAEQIPDTITMAVGFGNLARCFQNPDSIEYFTNKAMVFAKAAKADFIIAWGYFDLGNLYFNKKEYVLANENCRKSLRICKEKNLLEQASNAYNFLGKLFEEQNQLDSATFYYKASLRLNKLSNLPLLGSYKSLAKVFDKQNVKDSALLYYRLALTLTDSLNHKREISLTKYQSMSYEEQLRLQELEKEKILTQNKIRTYGMLGGIAILSVIGFLLYRNNRKEKKAKAVIEKALTELKSTQAQLIQSEKMASLGELTAGIAHEIQNPLNFVNNFSEVSNELLAEMKEELEKGNLDEVKEITNDVQQNLDKILHHGKRADAIVKGMLQHSRSSSGKKEPTDINALADEYLRLAYHGFRAKDKSFNAKMETDFDETIGKVNVIPQDIGRVILNLITNAFYAASRNPSKGETSESETAKIPTIWVATKKNDGNVLISVRDNGPGIPQNILDKIFQPFFTTKPTGQGTGLGLSLSYDIVKAHGGDLKVETVEGIGSEFIIQIPS